jgi:hypothetical protein
MHTSQGWRNVQPCRKHGLPSSVSTIPLGF